MSNFGAKTKYSVSVASKFLYYGASMRRLFIEQAMAQWKAVAVLS